jgi:hypothetical protein
MGGDNTMKKIYAKAEPHHNQARGGFAYR